MSITMELTKLLHTNTSPHRYTHIAKKRGARKKGETSTSSSAPAPVIAPNSTSVPVPASTSDPNILLENVCFCSSLRCMLYILFYDSHCLQEMVVKYEQSYCFRLYKEFSKHGETLDEDALLSGSNKSIAHRIALDVAMAWFSKSCGNMKRYA